MTEDYVARKVSSRCVRSGCRRRASDDCLLCPSHRTAARAARKRYNRQRRREASKRKLCADCPRKADARYCRRCAAMRLMRRPRKRRAGENAGEKSTTIAARTAVDATGRTRYHGQPRRGQQPRAQLDEKDIDDAIAALQRTKAGLALIRTSSDPQVARMHLKEAEQTALAIGALGVRHFGDVLLRNGCDPEMLITARDDEG